MRGIKLVHLPVSFRYSEGGQFKEETAVTVQAPGLDQFDVHSTMVAYASEAEIGLAIRFSKVDRSQMQASTDDAKLITVDAPETDDELVQRVMGAYSMGLGSEKFPSFMQWLKKTLTNNPKLARVGDTQVALKDESWNSIAEKGGMDAVNLVFASFAGFFLKAQPSSSASHEANGSSLPRTARSEAAVH